MKNILLLICFAAVLAYAAPMGHFDKVSGNWLVNNGRFSCSFLEGSMFPGDFTFSDGSTPGIILFRDTITGADKKVYALFEERWAETRIVQNDENTFIIERTGAFFRNANPVITQLKGVTATCRYEFHKNVPQMKMKFTFKKEKALTCRINSCMFLNWYAANPFAYIVSGKKQENFIPLPGQKLRNWDTGNELALKNRTFTVTLKADRCIATIIPGGLFPCRLNGGFWQYPWNGETMLEKEAVLRLERIQ